MSDEGPRTGAPRSSSALGEGAARVLRANDRGRMTVAAPSLYPHQWSWDAAFVAIGLARLSVSRACTELDHLLEGQWRTGMIPHIVYDDHAGGYFPDPARWGCAELSPDAPGGGGGPATSGITQPPVHAIAAARIVEVATTAGDRAVALEFVRRRWPALLAWHRWLAGPRRSPTTGLVRIVHGWESGMDNSPRFDGPYSRVAVGPTLPPYRRADVGKVADAGERPSDRDYDRYLWLIEELRAARYDDRRVVESSSFLVGDVLVSAITAAADESLATLGEAIGAPRHEIDELRSTAAWLAAAVAASVDPATGLATDVDERAGVALPSATLAGFAPLLSGGLDADTERRLVSVFAGTDWCGHPDLVVPAPPSTSPASPAFEARRYWRGPIWPVTVWLLGWALEHRGYRAAADIQRHAGLRLVGDGSFAEYYDPFTGEALGSAHQSWTAAVVLDWLGSGGDGAR